MKLAYLADVFVHSNKMNLELQGEHMLIFLNYSPKVVALKKKFSVLLIELKKNE